MLRLFSRLFMLLLFSVAVNAADLNDLRAQLEQKNYPAAITIGETLLQTRPDDRDVLFLTAYAMQMQQQTAEATRLYRLLIALHPEIPEPRNNLAMILLSQEKYDEATRLLVDALNTHPSYATTFRNLNEIYRGIASEAYRRAVSEPSNGSSFANTIQLDAISQLSPIETPAQLALVSQAPETPEAGTEADQAEAALSTAEVTDIKAPIETSPAPTTVEVTPASDTRQAEQAVSIAQVAEDKPPAEPPPAQPPVEAMPAAEASVETVAIATPVPKPIQGAPAASQVTGSEPLEQLVLDWASAWSSKAFDDYIGYYDSNYQSRFDSHQAWVEHRRQRIFRPGGIKVEISNIRVRARGENRVVLDFEQRYESSNYRDQVVKRLVLQRSNNQWKITSERVLSVL